MTFKRRKFIAVGTAAAATLSSPSVLGQGACKPRVFVIGGGSGGATAARYIAKDRKGATGTPFLSSPFPPASRQDWMGAADNRHSQAATPLPLIRGFLTQAISRENSRQL